MKELCVLSAAELTNMEVIEDIKKLENVDPNVILEYLKSMIPDAINFGIKVLIALIAYFIGSKIIRFLRKVVKRSLEHSQVEVGVIHFADSLVKVGLYVLLFLMIGSNFGLETSSVIAIVGSAGLAIGLALQGSLSNFAGGVLLLLLKPFRVGDYIIEHGSGKEGTVKQISLFYTILTTADNKVITVPNGILSNSSITNVTAANKRRIDLKVAIGYQTDMKSVKLLIEEILKNDESILQEEELKVYVEDLGESAVTLGARSWVKTEEYWDTRCRIIEKIKESFDENGISIPFRQMDVHIIK